MFSKEVFQTFVTIQNYLVQHDQNILKVMYVLHKIKNNMHFGRKETINFGGIFLKKYDLLIRLKICHWMKCIHDILYK